MTHKIKPWAKKAFELIFHAEHHWRRGMDYDKRLALISFDNSIEVSISIYLSLHPVQRNNTQYSKEDVEKWLKNYHTKLDFLEIELARRKLPAHRDKAHIVWLHEQRNELYHGSSGGVPEITTIEEIRFVALWVYSVLFDDADIELRLDEAINAGGKEEPFVPEVPIRPSMADMSDVTSDSDGAMALLGSSLIGMWDEGNPADMEIVKRLADGL